MSVLGVIEFDNFKTKQIPCLFPKNVFDSGSQRGYDLRCA